MSKHPQCPVKVPHNRHGFPLKDDDKAADFAQCDGSLPSSSDEATFSPLEQAALQMYYSIFMTPDPSWMAHMPDSVVRAYIRLGGVIDG